MPLIRNRPGAAPAVAAPTAARIREELGSADEQVRWSAARAASGLPACTPDLVSALATEASPRVRDAMFTSLAQTADDTALGALQAWLRSDDAQLRIGALDALRLLVRGDPALVTPLLQDADADVRILSCELVRELPAPQVNALLGELLGREAEPNVCAAAVDVMAEAGDASVLPVLTACARRFRDLPYLVFAIDVAIERISAQTPRSRG